MTIQVGRKTASLSGTFGAEGAVAVRRRSVVDLRIATNSGAVALRIATSSGAPPETQALPAPTLAPPVSVPRLFAPDSVWNAPLATTAPLDPSNATLVRTLQNTVAQNMAAGWGPWIGTDGTSPLYTVPANQPTVPVRLDAGAWNGALQQALDAVPIPPNAQPAAGPDGHLTVWQPSTDRMWELFQAQRMADGWHASYGGAMANVSRSPGYYDTSSWPGLSQPSWGATATSLPVIAGTIMIDELKAGVIPHALASTSRGRSPTSTRGRRSAPMAAAPTRTPSLRARASAWIPTVDLARLNLPPMTRMMAVAAQRYGMIVRDQTGHAVSFFAENPAQYGTDPYTSPGGFFGGPNPSAVVAGFPWQYLQLVKMSVRTAG